MRAIFSTIKLLFFGIWSFIAIMIGGLLYLVRVKNGMAWMAKVFWAPVVLRFLQARVKMVNESHLDPNQSYLIMANHNSFIDIPVLFKKMPFYTYFIAKKELRKIPLLGWYIKAYGMIFIDRSNRLKAQKSIAEAATLIADGKRVIIFPEGTKSKDGKIGPFKKGGFHLAKQANVPILPIKIENARNVWPNGKLFHLKRGEIIVKIGKPIEQKELEKMTVLQQTFFVKKIIESL